MKYELIGSASKSADSWTEDWPKGYQRAGSVSDRDVGPRLFVDIPAPLLRNIYYRHLKSVIVGTEPEAKVPK